MRTIVAVTLAAAVMAPVPALAIEQREAALLKALPIKAQIKHENKQDWLQRVHARRMERRAAARAAASVGAGDITSSLGRVPPAPTSDDGWADELVAVGFPSSVIPTMLYIIDRESGGDPSAINPTSNACGLTQIYPYQPGCLDPMTNLRMAYAKYRASGLSPWSM